MLMAVSHLVTGSISKTVLLSSETQFRRQQWIQSMSISTTRNKNSIRHWLLIRQIKTHIKRGKQKKVTFRSVKTRSWILQWWKMSCFRIWIKRKPIIQNPKLEKKAWTHKVKCNNYLAFSRHLLTFTIKTQITRISYVV